MNVQRTTIEGRISRAWIQNTPSYLDEVHGTKVIGLDTTFVLWRNTLERLVGSSWRYSNCICYNKVDSMLRKLKPSQKDAQLLSTLGGRQQVSIVSETGIYKVIMRSRRKEAEEFEDWVLETLRNLRQSTGLEGFQVFRMLDKNKTHPIRTQ